jgi:hypothetical protein
MREVTTMDDLFAVNDVVAERVEAVQVDTLSTTS